MSNCLLIDYQINHHNKNSTQSKEGSPRSHRGHLSETPLKKKKNVIDCNLLNLYS